MFIVRAGPAGGMMRQSGREDDDMFDCGVDMMDDPGMYVCV